jgi:predicted dehydrogenase
MNVAILGCGYVAEFYGKTFDNYPELRLVGAYDQLRSNLDAFVGRWPSRAYASLDELLADRSVDLVINLTNPRRHFETTRACLEAGKHVYSEKPLGMTVDEAGTLAALAAARSLYLGSAPCSVLSETAQTLGRALRSGVIGRVRLVYANFDDGMIAPRQQPWTWRNELGVAWPAQDEFEVGCTFEHAGYVLTWLAAFFGPARAVTAFSSCQIPDKGIAVHTMAPDFSVGCIEYGDNVVARVTCGLVAPRDKSITIVGDDGVLFVGNVRQDAGPVMRRGVALSGWRAQVAARLGGVGAWIEARTGWPAADVLFQQRLPLVRQPAGHLVSPSKPVDFMRGPAELAAAVVERRPSRLSAELGVHIVEVVRQLQHPEPARREMTTVFPPMAPMPWAE